MLLPLALLSQGMGKGVITIVATLSIVLNLLIAVVIIAMVCSFICNSLDVFQPFYFKLVLYLLSA